MPQREEALHNWEFKLAAGCMATVIHQIANDTGRMMKRHKRKLEITLVTDHRNREGVDHLVKMIVWSSWDTKKKKQFFGILTSTLIAVGILLLLQRMQVTNLYRHCILMIWILNTPTFVEIRVAAREFTNSILS
jgi:hypothetical protein